MKYTPHAETISHLAGQHEVNRKFVYQQTAPSAAVPQEARPGNAQGLRLLPKNGQN